MFYLNLFMFIIFFLILFCNLFYDFYFMKWNFTVNMKVDELFSINQEIAWTIRLKCLRGLKHTKHGFKARNNKSCFKKRTFKAFLIQAALRSLQKRKKHVVSRDSPLLLKSHEPLCCSSFIRKYTFPPSTKWMTSINQRKKGKNKVIQKETHNTVSLIKHTRRNNASSSFFA